MKSTPSTRRDFICGAALSAAAGVLSTCPARAAGDSGATGWEIMCVNRPWTTWNLPEMLDGARDAGYRTVVLQTPTPRDPFNGADATPAYLQAVKAAVAARGLRVIAGRLRTKDGAPREEAETDIRRQLDNAQALGFSAVMHTGTNKPEHYTAWYRLIGYAAAYGADRGIEIAIKPHGGVVATGADLLTSLERIGRPNVCVWYDAGNIIHYTGRDPLEELEPVAGHVKAFTGKDCGEKGGEVMLQFGEGKVDFLALFRRLKKAGFRGPIMMESCRVGKTPGETTANARANRKHLESVLARV